MAGKYKCQWLGGWEKLVVIGLIYDVWLVVSGWLSVAGCDQAREVGRLIMGWSTMRLVGEASWERLVVIGLVIDA